MRRPIRRVAWSLSRLRPRRLVLLVPVAIAGGGTAWFLDAPAAALGGVAILFGVLLAGPLAALWSRYLLRTAPWRAVGADPAIGGWRLGFEVSGVAGEESPHRQVGEIISSSPEAGAGDLFLELWLVASDEDGARWTPAQEIVEPPAGRSVWTSSIDGWLTVADFDPSGRPNPFKAANRLVAAEFDVPVVSVDIVAWGTEVTPIGGRHVVVAVVTTHAEDLEPVVLGESLVERRFRRVELDPDGVSDALGRVHGSQWRGGAVVGLLESLDRVCPGWWAAAERRVAASWREKAMFARVERGTAQVSGRALALRS